MILTTILGVALGLFLVYFFMSSLASVIGEVVSMFLQRRSTTMAQFIIAMFNEQNMQEYPNAANFYASPIFQLKEIGGFLGAVAAFGEKLLGWLHRQKWAAKWAPDVSPIKGSEQILSISNGNFSQAVFEVLNFAIGDSSDKTFQNLQQVVTDVSDGALLKNSPLKAALIVAIQQADGKVEKVADNLESWFDGQMAQLTDLYKRQTRIYLFFIGIVLAILLNVDTIAIYQALQSRPELQAAAENVAGTVVGNGLSTYAATPEATPDLSPQHLQAQISDLYGKVGTVMSQFNQLNLPIGWNNPVGDFWSKLLGILITSAATALGAPFWFDVIKLLTGRGSGD